MSNLRKKLMTFLPLIVGLVIMCSAFNAKAGTVDWVVDKAAETAAIAMGIDTTDNCIPPQAHSSCLFCPLFKILFNAGNYVAQKAYDTFSTDLGKLIVVFLAVSLALIILKNIASMSSKDPGTIMNDIFRKGFVCIVIFIIVTKDYYNLMNLTIVPIIQTAMSFTNMVDPLSMCSDAGGLGGFTSTAGAGESAGLPSSIGTMILCSAQNIEAKINLLFENGRWAFCLGTGPNRLFHIIPHPVYIIDGLFLYLGGIFFLVAYPWVLGDAILQMGIALALLPFAVAGYAFNGTKSYLPKVFGWILHSLFVFIFMAILITCILTYIANLLIAATSVVDPKVLFTDSNSGIAFFGPNMVMLIFVLVIGWSYMPMTKDLAGKFSEGSGLSAAQEFGTKLTNAMERQVEKVADKATDVAIDATKDIANSAALRSRAIGRRSMIGITNAMGTSNGYGGKTLNFGAFKYSTMRLSNGKQILKRDWTNPVNLRKHEMFSDKYTTIRQEHDKNGNLIYSDVEFKKDFLKKYLFNADNSINLDAYNHLMSSTMAQDPELRKAIFASIAEQRLKAAGIEIGQHYRSRTVTIDPHNPNKILVEQVDYNGKKTSFSMEINSQTGQVAVAMKRQRAHHHNNSEDYEVFFDNGVVSMHTTGERDPNTGQILNEVTVAKASAVAQKGHDSIKAQFDDNQVVDSTGGISKYLRKNLASDATQPNPYDLTFGMDDMFGVTNIGGMTTTDFIVNNVFAEGRRRKSNKFASNVGGYFL